MPERAGATWRACGAGHPTPAAGHAEGAKGEAHLRSALTRQAVGFLAVEDGFDQVGGQEATLHTGQPQEKVPATVTRQADEVNLLISTSLKDGVVHIVIEEMNVASPAPALPK